MKNILTGYIDLNISDKISFTYYLRLSKHIKDNSLLKVTSKTLSKMDHKNIHLFSEKLL